MKLEFELENPEATISLGKALGRILQPGAVVLLSGGLGAGKTVLASGLARGLGVDPEYCIVSPTFTLLNIYPGRVEFFHADLYRLSGGEAGELELLEEAARGVLVVEWAERAAGSWPGQAVGIELTLAGEQVRKAVVQGPDAILEELSSRLADGGPA